MLDAGCWMLDAGREDDSRKAREGRGDLEWREEKPRITRMGTDGELTTESTEDTEINRDRDRDLDRDRK